MISWISLNFFTTKVEPEISSTLYIITYILLNVVGLTVGVFLLWFEIDRYNPALQKFCIGSSKKINCNAVLDSKYAKIFSENLSLSLLSFAYFFGTLFSLLIYKFHPFLLSVLGILSFMTAPVIFISIYYQAVILKQWCKFCIIIQIILISEIFFTFFNKFYTIPFLFAFETLLLLLALFLSPILLWGILKPLIIQKKETIIYRRELKKIKNDPAVLDALLIKSRKIKTPIEGLGILINNNNTKYHVIKVCNPYCSPCAKAHPILETLVDNGVINLQMLFTAKADGKDIKAKPVSHFLAIDAEGDKKKTKKTLDDWYQAKQKNYDLFVNKHPTNGILKQQNNKIQAMREWCEAENITHTPTIFINGYELPKEYSVEDLTDVLF